MDASVTLKLNPADFDFMRDALMHYAANEKEVIYDASITPKERAEARKNLARASEILAKLGR